MSWLRWDDARRKFVGSRLTVTAHAFQAAVDTLVANGIPEHEAVLMLLEEEQWSWTDAGVTVLSARQRRIGPRAERCRPGRHT